MQRYVKGLVERLIDKLFGPEQRRLDGMLKTLNQENKEASDSFIDGFLYKGEFFLPKSGSLTVAGRGRAKSVLHLSLHGRMQDWLVDRQGIEDDMAFVKQGLMQLLRPCKTTKEIRNTLPEALIPLAPELAPIPREDEPGCSIRDDERAMRQFQKILPKLEAYSVSRLFC